jgi:hypothetical protein
MEALEAELSHLGRGVAQAQEAVVVALGDRAQEHLGLARLALLLR